ncbi:MAG TPA: hypothetical protein VL989_01130 [Candidatus Sulfotelmatobacter sp.]|nr:hypothetical protein [Candidatus Sulfotelmatobacter sp.]
MSDIEQTPIAEIARGEGIRETLTTGIANVLAAVGVEPGLSSDPSIVSRHLSRTVLVGSRSAEITWPVREQVPSTAVVGPINKRTNLRQRPTARPHSG